MQGLEKGGKYKRKRGWLCCDKKAAAITAATFCHYSNWTRIQESTLHWGARTQSHCCCQNTSASALRTALSPLSENPGTGNTTEELALPLLLLPKTPPKTWGKWLPLSSCLTNLLSGHHAESSVNQVSVFLLLPVWPEKAKSGAISQRDSTCLQKRPWLCSKLPMRC